MSRASVLLQTVALLAATSAGVAQSIPLTRLDTWRLEGLDEGTAVVRDSAAGVVGQVKSTAQDLVDRGRSLVETKKDQVTAAVEAGKQAYQEKRNELESDVQEDLDSAPTGVGSSGTAPAA